MPSAVPAEIFKALQAGSPPPGLAADESQAFERLAFLFTHGLPIFSMMANHPQALYAIADSPVGLAAWFLEHDVAQIVGGSPQTRSAGFNCEGGFPLTYSAAVATES